MISPVDLLLYSYTVPVPGNSPSHPIPSDFTIHAGSRTYFPLARENSMNYMCTCVMRAHNSPGHSEMLNVNNGAWCKLDKDMSTIFKNMLGNAGMDARERIRNSFRSIRGGLFRRINSRG